MFSKYKELYSTLRLINYNISNSALTTYCFNIEILTNIVV